MAEKKHLLVLDDSNLICQLLRLTLEGDGYVVHVTNTVEEAEHKLRERHYDLVILDYNLKDNHTGFEMFASIEAQEESERPKMVMLSAESEPEHKREAKEHGVCAWFTKPFSPRSLIEFVHICLGDGEGQSMHADHSSQKNNHSASFSSNTR